MFLLCRMMPLPRLKPRFLLATVVCVLAGASAAITARGADLPALTDAQRVAAVKALRPANEEMLPQNELLSSLGRYGFPRDSEEKESGRIEISLTDEQGGPMALDGWFSYETDDGADYGCLIMRLRAGIAPVKNGRATVVLRGTERRAILYADGLPGYALAKKDRFGRKAPQAVISLPKDGTSVSETLSLEPAGAIRWRVVDQNGKPETETVKYWLHTPPYSTGAGDMDRPHNRFFVRSARFKESYRLILQKGARFLESSPEQLTLGSPAADVVIAFKPGKTVLGRLLKADGKPFPGVVLSLAYQTLAEQPTMVETAAKLVTGVDGSFAFEAINFEMPNRYWLVCEPARGAENPHALPFYRIPVDSKTPLPVEMRLPGVYAARGRLLDAKTGVPVVGARVHALVREELSETGHPIGLSVFRVPAVAPTDTNGAFHFTNLSAGVYDFMLQDGNVARDGSQVSAAGSAMAGKTNIDLLRVPQTEVDGEEAPTFWVYP